MVTMRVKDFEPIRRILELQAIRERTSVKEILNAEFEWTKQYDPSGYRIMIYFNDPEEEIMFRLKHGV